MKKLLIFFCLMVTVCRAEDFYIAISRTDWNAITAVQKQKVKAELAKCTDAPISIKLNWNYSNTVTGVEWGIARYSKGAWVLKQKETMDAVKIAKIKSFLASANAKVGWTSDFDADLIAAHLVVKPKTGPY